MEDLLVSLVLIPIKWLAASLVEEPPSMPVFGSEYVFQSQITLRLLIMIRQTLRIGTTISLLGGKLLTW